VDAHDDRPDSEDSEDTEDSEDGEDSEAEGEEEEEAEEETTPTQTAQTGAATTSFVPGTVTDGRGHDTASSVDSDLATTATGRNPVVIGGDGYDDLAVRSRGDRNVVSYDDSNVVIGGSGDVSAQIGDCGEGG
jgi:hypothetical protein